MHQKKVISKNVTEICTFSTFTHVRQTCFAYNFITFFGAFFNNFFNGFEISVKFCVFLHLFDFFPKKIVYVILVLFSNFEAKRAKNGSKIKKYVFCKCVLEFNFAPIKGSIFFTPVVYFRQSWWHRWCTLNCK